MWFVDFGKVCFVSAFKNNLITITIQKHSTTTYHHYSKYLKTNLESYCECTTVTLGAFGQFDVFWIKIYQGSIKKNVLAQNDTSQKYLLLEPFTIGHPTLLSIEQHLLVLEFSASR